MKLSKNRVVALVFIFIGICGVIMTSQLEVRKIFATAADIGPKCFPYISTIGMILCGLGLFFTNDNDDGTKFLNIQEFKKILLLMGIFVIYTLALKYIGFLISSPFLMFVLIRLLRGDSKTTFVADLIISVAFPTVIYFAFVYLLEIMLPAGMLF